MTETPAANAVREASRVVPAACPHDCPDTCAIRVTVDGGRAVRIQGAAEHRFTAGALCTKVSRYLERTYHPERVLQPLRRTSRKDEPPRFEPIGWDEAIATIAARLGPIAARDPRAVVPYSYAGTMGQVQGEGMAGRFFHRLGASLLDRTICAQAGAEALEGTYGAKLGMHVQDFARAKLIVIWGSNSIASNLHFWTIAQQAKRDGATLVCIDPRRSETAEKCHRHLAIRPGTDGALALGLMHELIAHGWVDEAYVAKAFPQESATGWPALRERARQWPPERVAQVCGIDADDVRWLAKAYGTATPAAIRLNYGMQRVRGGGNAVRLVALLPCVTGAWQHGGGMLLSASGWAGRVRRRIDRPDLLATHHPDRPPRTINMSTIGAALLHPGGGVFGPRIEALVVYNSNPVAVAPQSGEVVAGFRRADLFTVVLEHFMTDTADLADIVLPATTQLEHLDVVTSYGHTDVVFNEPAIAPLGQAKPNAQIFRELAAAMGFDDPCFAETDEQLARQLFDDAVVPFETLRTTGWAPLPVAARPFADGVFPTPDGRLILQHPQFGFPDHVPNVESAEVQPALAARYPLAMISPPARNFLNSSFVNVKSLRDIEGEPVLEMHPSDAAPRGIADGTVVRVFNDRGSYRCAVRVGERARPGVVNGLGIWWRKLGRDGTNVNELTSQALTDIGRAATFYDCLVEVEAAA